MLMFYSLNAFFLRCRIYKLKNFAIVADEIRIQNKSCNLSPVHTTKFSLDKFYLLVYSINYKFFLTSFICSCVQHKLTNFPLIWFFLDKFYLLVCTT